MLPVSLQLDGPTGTKEFRFEVVRDYFLTLPVIQALMGGTVTAHAFNGGLGTITTDVVIRLRDGSEVLHHDVVATLAPSEQVAIQTATPIGLLFGNPYGEPSVESIDLRVRIDETVHFSVIDEVNVLDEPVRPGDTVRLQLMLRPYRGERREETITFEIPRSMPAGRAVLRVADRVSMDEWDRDRAPDKFRHPSMGAFLDRLRSLPAHNEIEVRLYVPGSSFVVSGEEMPRLPPSVRKVLGDVRTSGARGVADGIEVASRIVEWEGHVMGSHTLALEVVNR
jgi:hypothetical protein